TGHAADAGGRPVVRRWGTATGDEPGGHRRDRPIGPRLLHGGHAHGGPIAVQHPHHRPRASDREPGSGAGRSRSRRRGGGRRGPLAGLGAAGGGDPPARFGPGGRDRRHGPRSRAPSHRRMSPRKTGYTPSSISLAKLGRSG